MTNLESIQENTSEFNISFHLRQSIAEAMMQVFLFEPNRKKVEETLKIKTEPYDVRDVILANMFNDIVKAYLSASFDGEDTADTPQTEREGE